MQLDAQLSGLHGQRSDAVDEIRAVLAQSEEMLQGEVEARAQAERIAEAQRQEADELAEQLVESREQLKARSEMCEELEHKLAEQIEVVTDSEDEVLEEDDSVEIEGGQEDLIEVSEAEVEKGVCDCCGESDISKSALVTIDSGQIFCPECLEALRGG